MLKRHKAWGKMPEIFDITEKLHAQTICPGVFYSPGMKKLDGPLKYSQKQSFQA